MNVRTSSFSLVHINHQLRPNSKEDADFVENTLKAGASLALYIRSHKKTKGNIEEWARKQRYEFLKTRQENLADFPPPPTIRDDIEFFPASTARHSGQRHVRHANYSELHLRPCYTSSQKIQEYIQNIKYLLRKTPAIKTKASRNWLRHTLIPQIEANYRFYRALAKPKPYWNSLQTWIEQEAENFWQSTWTPAKA